MGSSFEGEGFYEVVNEVGALMASYIGCEVFYSVPFGSFCVKSFGFCKNSSKFLKMAKYKFADVAVCEKS